MSGKHTKGARNLASTVSQLYDYKQANIPEELTRWHVTEEEVQAALTVLSQEHAALAQADRAEDGDAVQCVCLTAPQEGRTVLVYPGRKLPGAEEAEEAVLGRRAGDRFSCELVSSPVTLEVREVLRLTPHPVDDELIRLAGIDGVSTLAEYRARFTEETGAEKRNEAAWKIVMELAEAVTARSQLDIDQEEMRKWTEARVQQTCARAAASGEPLEDGEALEEERRIQEKAYRDALVFRCMSQQDGFFYDWKAFEAIINQWLADNADLAAVNGMTRESLLTQEEFARYEHSAYMGHVYDMLLPYAEQLLEV